MAQIIWTKSALNELNEIAEYIALHNPIAASHLVEKIFTKIERLEQFPESGRTPPELLQFGYREVVIPPCRIFYRIANDTVYIVHTCREERDLQKFLKEKGD
jgi:toxin ParE1/3/4